MYLCRVVESAPQKMIFESPNHPYTQALLDEVPDIDKRKVKFTVVEGEIPSPLDPPTGCHFHPRCRFSFERCKKESPQLKDISFGWKSACHLNN